MENKEIQLDLKHLIPKNKFDEETAKKLKDHSYEELKQIIPQLLEWIQDMNWPVASIVADYLISISKKIQKEILDIITGSDIMWKYWCISVICYNSPDALSEEVLSEIVRIAQNPTQFEIENEVNEEAIAVLKKRHTTQV